MKIGIITFHWGANYGGVLQAYALQQFLKKNIKGSEVSIINYVPKTPTQSLFKCIATRKIKYIPSNLITYFKERNFVPFRDKNLILTKKYSSLKELQEDPPELDVYITGSDQVWNPYIINKHGTPYFLTFGDKSIKRISYAVSFGCTEYPERELSLIKPFIEKFDVLSVRENTGLSILEKVGITKVELMPDPTLLLEESDLERLISEKKKTKSKKFIFFYILQENQNCIQEIYNYLKSRKGIKTINTKRLRFSTINIESWLFNIKYAKCIITNSFHGVVFSILFNKNFIVVPIEGRHKGMNDRIYTLLNKFDLNDRILEKYDEALINSKIDNPIDWNKVNQTKKRVSSLASEFLKNGIINP
ncbi:polysaccharide pyruvyl transferase family protein [Albibacterium bauzanense]|uniref:Polysaccharide pyruvyl transferase n=1 Tax=Albibacterium bauzanense TaxID=653929 RepID=A0A4R1M156_9SPHI|nr:polysaccharide pyruvyl transferase family protein [Albibacterium bauzanense]TCK84942.1 polysaccharide pyruvyl transferase [Albibacterium bauzanense]